MRRRLCLARVPAPGHGPLGLVPVRVPLAVVALLPGRRADVGLTVRQVLQVTQDAGDLVVAPMLGAVGLVELRVLDVQAPDQERPDALAQQPPLAVERLVFPS